MFEELRSLIGDHVNFVFIGEAGSGKSEISLNFAKYLIALGDRPVHYFDLDMTKPLFRARDVLGEVEAMGVIFHFEEQFMDAPTQVGGVNRLLRDPDCYVILDIGGDYIGARAIGGYAPEINRDMTLVYYVLNAYRPWSNDIDHIDETLAKILGLSHIELGQLHMVNNPNNGLTTTAREFLEGSRKMAAMVTPYIAVDFACVREDLLDEVREASEVPVMPVHLYLTYEWLQMAPYGPGGPPLPGKG